ncbi:hypothetical protein DM01DRAFT_1334518 [Hesseltinella vesiculosa]|uniref:DNA-directed RNA polymerase I, subunit RPA34.5 n=1 Tax=Hesseltinella vesiculosa TaxID=101127 RepID=A0A1X2GNH8_9FUNG|nr:hypothetical protein DM01DRAFT_1334518 [Hesseltinella vesiculosa]
MAFTIDEHLPEGFTKVDPTSQSTSLFDTTALDDDKEIWLIRVPNEVSAEELCSMQLKQGKSAGKPKSRLLLNDNDKYTMYRVPDDQDEKDMGVSGQEMFGLECLLPSGGGKLSFAPKSISNYLILDEEIDIPDGVALAEAIRERPIPKREQPTGLQMRFKPYGFDTNPDSEQPRDTAMETPAKKRKVDDDQPSKKKKEKKKDKKH